MKDVIVSWRLCSLKMFCDVDFRKAGIGHLGCISVSSCRSMIHCSFWWLVIDDSNAFTYSLLCSNCNFTVASSFLTEVSDQPLAVITSWRLKSRYNCSPSSCFNLLFSAIIASNSSCFWFVKIETPLSWADLEAIATTSASESRKLILFSVDH